MALKFLPLFVSTLGYLGFAILMLKVRPLLAPLLWACFVTTFIYCFAILGLLELGARTALILGVVLGAIALYKQRKSLPKPDLNWLSLIIFAVPFVIAFTATPKDFVFLAWDEVGGWAKTQKLIYDTDALLNANSPMSLRSYPPGQQLFQYYFTKSSWWSEKHLLVAQNIFLLSGLLALVGALITRITWAALVYLTLLPVIYFFHFDYTTIYADPMLASVFAGCLGLALKPRSGRIDDLVLAVCLCGFVLLKDIATVFAALCLALYCVNVFNSQAAASAITIRQRLTQTGTALFISVAAIFAVLRSWQWYVSVIGSSKNEPLHVTLKTFTEAAFQSRLGTTVSGFIFQVFKPDYFSGSFGSHSFNLSLAGIVATIVTIGALIVALTPSPRRMTMLLSIGGMFAGAIGYLLLLLWLYLTYFTEYEGTRLASFDRYSMTYLLAWGLASYTLLLAAVSRFTPRLLIVVPLLGLTLAFTFAPAKFYTDARQTPIDLANFEKKKKAQALADEVRKHIKSGEKVYFIAQNTNGYERHLFDYAMLPYPPVDCWSIGKKYDAGDVWSCDRPLGFFLQGYAYVAIYHADARFWEENSELFAPEGRGKDSGVYRITRLGKDQIVLSPTKP